LSLGGIGSVDKPVFNSPRNGVDFHFNAVPQNRLYRGSCRPNARKEFRVSSIKTIEIPNVSQVTRTLHDIVKTVSGCLKDLSNMRKRQPGFVLYRASHYLTGSQVQRSLAADEQPTIYLNAR